MIPRLIRPAAAVLLVVLIVSVTPAAAAAQEVGGEAAGEASEVEVRIVARRLESGRIEFGLQQRGAGGEWGERMLPLRRFFPPGATVGRWLHSSTFGIDTTPATEVRIVARRLESGRIEFGLQQRGAGDEWDERRLPQRRFFPSDATIGRWLASSTLTLPPAPDTADGPVSLRYPSGVATRSGDTLVAASSGRTCAVNPGGGVTCWGGSGLRERLSASTLADVRTISIGDGLRGAGHACVLHSGGTVSCWGSGWSGQLGQGDTTSRLLPVVVPGIADAVALAAGAHHTCVVHRDRGVSCWGDNSLGQLGDGTGESALLPRRVPALADVATLAAGQVATCAVHIDGSLSCWGWGVGGLGRADTLDYLAPQRIRGLGEVTSVSIGSSTCAVTAEATVYCWPFSTSMRPILIDGVSDAVAVSSGRGRSCALHRDGGVSCWGTRDNTRTRLADEVDRLWAAARVPGVDDVVAISLAQGTADLGSHACAVQDGGSVLCWGANEVGQLGDGTTESRAHPVRVVEFDDVPDGWSATTDTSVLRTWLDLEIEQWEDEFPWLRTAWDHIRGRTESGQVGSFGGQVAILCHVAGGSSRCRADGMTISRLDFRGVVHELAHVYDHTTGLAPAKAWGAVQLYFASTYPDCFTGLGWPGSEILADTVMQIVSPGQGFTYYGSDLCPSLPDSPDREAMEVVRAGLAGEVADWYTENITNGAELWAALRRGPNLPAIINLAGEFGGLCTTGWITHPLDATRLPPAGSNPFRDGGC